MLLREDSVADDVVFRQVDAREVTGAARSGRMPSGSCFKLLEPRGRGEAGSTPGAKGVS